MPAWQKGSNQSGWSSVGIIGKACLIQKGRGGLMKVVVATKTWLVYHDHCSSNLGNLKNYRSTQYVYNFSAWYLFCLRFNVEVVLLIQCKVPWSQKRWIEPTFGLFTNGVLFSFFPPPRTAFLTQFTMLCSFGLVPPARCSFLSSFCVSQPE